MTESRELAAVLDGALDEQLLERVLGAARGAPNGEAVRAGLEAMAGVAEADPGGMHDALWALRGDPEALRRLEGSLDMSPERATLALGGAIQLASAELSETTPNLRSRLPELQRWLEGSW